MTQRINAEGLSPVKKWEGLRLDAYRDVAGVLTIGYILELGPAGGVSTSGGVGLPDGVITAAVSSIWLRTDAGPWSKIYSKEEGSGNTGWGS